MIFLRIVLRFRKKMVLQSSGIEVDVISHKRQRSVAVVKILRIFNICFLDTLCGSAGHFWHLL